MYERKVDSAEVITFTEEKKEGCKKVRWRM